MVSDLIDFSMRFEERSNKEKKEKICKCGMIGRIVPFIKVIDQDRRHQARIKLHDSKVRYVRMSIVL